MEDFQLWKDIALVVAIGARVFEILGRMKITQKGPGFGGIGYRWSWVSKVESALAVGGFGAFLFLTILERFFTSRLLLY
jgi:hypothetical protein